MDVIDAIRGRRSIRKFRSEGIPEDMMDRLIESLILAPSAGNLQSRKFYFIKDDVVKKALAVAALGQNFIAKAPLVIVCCTDSRIENRYGERGIHLYSIQDVSASIMSMMLAAHEMGLGSVWVGAFNEGQVFDVLGMQAHLRPVSIVPVGWPDTEPSPTSRVSEEEAIAWVT
ncbi:MAG: nitroreductase family protein [Nitrospirota bacterium]|nr:MAG: nitroreductase family protein [Nitrospirota bacterium]